MADTSLWGMLQNVQPVVIISDDISNRISMEVNAIPIIGNIKQIMFKNYAVVIGNYGVHGKNIVATERMVLIDETQVMEKVGSIRGTIYMDQITQAIKSYLGTV